jgi:hypothetical protein
MLYLLVYDRKIKDREPNGIGYFKNLTLLSPSGDYMSQLS